MSQNAFVITCNDSIEAVVTGTRKQAEAEMERRRDEYFNRNRSHFRDSRQTFDMMTNWAAREHDLIQLGA